jgi:hypothetical protein
MRFFTLKCYFKRVKTSVILDSGNRHDATMLYKATSIQRFNATLLNFDTSIQFFIKNLKKNTIFFY